MNWKDGAIKALGGILVILIGFGVQTMNEISHSLTDIKISLNSVVSQIGYHEQRIDALEGRVVGRGPKGWHRQDMKSCMRELIIANPGFKGCDTRFE